jgi:SAM-dependent methyltransferase
VNAEVYRYLVKYLPINGTILDAGCGYFTYADSLKRYNNKIVCVDILNLDASQAQKNYFFLASVEYLPFKDNSIDFIYSLSVIQLIKDDVGVISEFCRVLKPGGKLLFTVPTKRSIFKLIRELEIRRGVYRSPEFNVKHYHYYNRSDIENLASGRFKLIEIYGYEYNFVPRLLLFLVSISKLKNILRDIRSRFITKKSQRKHTTNSHLSKRMSACAKENTSFISLRGNLKFINDFSYHYIVVLGKM